MSRSRSTVQNYPSPPSPRSFVLPLILSFHRTVNMYIHPSMHLGLHRRDQQQAYSWILFESSPLPKRRLRWWRGRWRGCYHDSNRHPCVLHDLFLHLSVLFSSILGTTGYIGEGRACSNLCGRLHYRICYRTIVFSIIFKDWLLNSCTSPRFKSHRYWLSFFPTTTRNLRKRTQLVLQPWMTFSRGNTFATRFLLLGRTTICYFLTYRAIRCFDGRVGCGKDDTAQCARPARLHGRGYGR